MEVFIIIHYILRHSWLKHFHQSNNTWEESTPVSTWVLGTRSDGSSLCSLTEVFEVRARCPFCGLAFCSFSLFFHHGQICCHLMWIDGLADVLTSTLHRVPLRRLPAGTSQMAGIWRNLPAGSFSRGLVGGGGASFHLGSENLRFQLRMGGVVSVQCIRPGPQMTELV